MRTVSRRKGRANQRAGLWQDTPDETYVPAHDLRIEQEISPLTRPCPACHAATGQRCTRPARNGRTDLRGWHPSRLNPSECDTQETP
jgi:hypothetical protein